MLHPLRRAGQPGGPGDRLCRHRSDVAIGLRHDAGRVREGDRAAVAAGAGRCTSSCTATCAASWAGRTARTRCRPRVICRPTCWGTCGRRNGPTSTRWSSPTRGSRSLDVSAAIVRKKWDAVKMVKTGESVLHLAGAGPAAEDLLGAVDVDQAARPRGGLPRQRLGRDHERRSAHQDVHQADGGGSDHHPPRAGPQLLLPRVLQAAGRCTRTAPTTASTRRSATP